MYERKNTVSWKDSKLIILEHQDIEAYMYISIIKPIYIETKEVKNKNIIG